MRRDGRRYALMPAIKRTVSTLALVLREGSALSVAHKLLDLELALRAKHSNHVEPLVLHRLLGTAGGVGVASPEVASSSAGGRVDARLDARRRLVLNSAALDTHLQATLRRAEGLFAPRSSKKDSILACERSYSIGPCR